MKLYREVLIETIAQAEALPDDAIVINDSGDRYNHVPGRRGGWHSSTEDRDLSEDLASTFLPPKITALVPMEGEEETRVGVDRAEQNLWSMALEASAYGERVSLDGIHMAHRFKTAWMPQERA